MTLLIVFVPLLLACGLLDVVSARASGIVVSACLCCCCDVLPPKLEPFFYGGWRLETDRAAAKGKKCRGREACQIAHSALQPIYLLIISARPGQRTRLSQHTISTIALVGAPS